MSEIRVSAVILRRADGHVLLVRKRGTTAFMQPGGKPEPGEDARACAVRELEEELGLRLDPAGLQPLGEHRAAAANEHGWTVVADCFLHPQPVPDEVRPAAEIVETRWVDPASPPADVELAPLFAQHIARLL
ncbi:NUDIX domain-containing protein [uncultured Tessaracoccus sp.]|uniref:NUDIX hydrolase n=1 Tax=uncultured Tessaracoccus sp. TaxID=905023 RepID=UPI0025FB1E8A|nr:NUDIX domain-containing protein [uncultured Tessaracoccus sp.]